jgi:hypothetical protein
MQIRERKLKDTKSAGKACKNTEPAKMKASDTEQDE